MFWKAKMRSFLPPIIRLFNLFSDMSFSSVLKKRGENSNLKIKVEIEKKLIKLQKFWKKLNIRMYRISGK
jgi:hypothetical protein